MRPVNLIPPDERRGDAAPLRTGYLIYVLVAGMALLLLGIVVVALTGKQINDREAKKADLQKELVQATAEAQSLQAFTNFRAVQENRATTVSSLVQSRFDWTRVLHELSLVLPSDVTLTSLNGSASPQTTASATGSSAGSGGGDLSGSIQGPSLSIEGCAPGQDGVAGFVSALEDIDGVTRVGLSSSRIEDPDAASSDSSGGSGSSDNSQASCYAGPRTATFQIVIAFDSAPMPATATSSPSVPTAVPPPGGTAVASTQTPGS